jgi:hypothetical protein
VGVHRVLGVAETIARITKTNFLNSVPHLELPGILAAARHQLLNAVRALGTLGGVKIDMSVEHLVGQPHDPGPALADLAIGHCRQVGPERPAERSHNVLDRLERHATKEKKILTHYSLAATRIRNLRKHKLSSIAGQALFAN